MKEMLDHTERNHSHEEDLHATTKEQWQEHAITRRTEHVTVNQFPSKLLLGIFLQSSIHHFIHVFFCKLCVKGDNKRIHNMHNLPVNYSGMRRVVKSPRSNV